MAQIHFGAARLANVLFVRRYPVDRSIRRQQFRFEDAFAEQVGKLSVLNVPDDGPANLPWFVLADGTRRMSVSAVSTELNLDFSGTGRPQDFSGMLNRYARQLDRSFDDLFAAHKRGYSAIILTFEVPYHTNDQVEYAELMAAQLLRKTPRRLDSFGFNVSTKTSEFEFTGSIIQYKRRTIRPTVVAGLGGIYPPFVDLDFEKPDEEGVQIKVDVNTKPQLDAPKKGAFQAVVRTFSTPQIKETNELAGDCLATFLDGG